MTKRATTNNAQTLKDAVAALDRASSWLIVSHERADGDTAGSASAFADVAQRLGKKWRWVGKDPLPDFLDFLPHADAYEACGVLPHVEEGVCVVAVDVSTPERAPEGIDLPQRPFPLVVIDHHGDNAHFGDVCLVDVEAAATGEVVWRMIREGGWPLSPNAAMGLYTAVMTDCGRFSFSNTTPETHRIAADLLEAGARPDAVFECLYARASVGKLHLWGLALGRVHRWCDGRVGFTHLLEEDFSATATDRSHLDGLVNELLLLEGSDFAVLLTEQEAMTHASLRSKGCVNAQLVAHRWGGGGHPQAAGFKTPLPLHYVEAGLKRDLEFLYASGDPRSR